MSDLKFSSNKNQSKVQRFFSSKGFYIALAICLVSSGVATWFAVEHTLNGIEEMGSLSSPSSPITAEDDGDNDDKTDDVNNPVSDQQKSSSSSSSSEPESETSSTPNSSTADTSSSNTGNTSSSPAANSSDEILFIMPVSGEITKEFSAGELVKSTTLGDWRTHDGIDIEGDISSPVKATANGVVSEVYEDSLWGTVVEIEHAGGYVSSYSGLSKQVHVTPGQEVSYGDVIGSIGDTATAEIMEPIHLHFCMKKDGEYIDPLSVIKQL